MSERNYCPICRGDRRIKLPLYRQSVATWSTDEAMAMEESSRIYLCPECSPKSTEENVALLKYEATAAIQYEGEPGYQEHVYANLANNLAYALLRDGHIKFTSLPADKTNLTRLTKATLGVVSANVVASMEDRIAERQLEVAAKLVPAASRKIRIWGSYYGDTHVSKDQAIESVIDAFKELAKELALERTPPSTEGDGP